MSRYNRSIPGGVLHEDALLIKTAPIKSNTFQIVNKERLQFELKGNLISDHLNLTGPLNLIKNWAIFSLHGDQVLYGSKWIESASLINFKSGMYSIRIIDKNRYQYFFKFVKI